MPIICDKQRLTKNNYLGTPDLLVEVLSPSTTAKDYIVKMNLYMQSGVKEYWIASPRNRSVQVFVLNGDAYGENR
ncbi:Restriction endonuclease type II-like [Acididesulfobacillus acetoxydans]|uniref:Restriction endonuclease type II-like n=1 Tax=Acididesulfobacillus acetoxydans TaxID=1561005 RepID=A0A8S0VWA5_9FIRM|nr:Uma2 family endonuclease [Acididesulfobacillus acetoxydans]CAA7600633.1 Restriction endonuclease type II-like [Acididesulfobacillus acetoxydans]CEJ09414.1 Restriction endonuclease type II-like [Acididesulfobacillus acetoxydans]